MGYHSKDAIMDEILKAKAGLYLALMDARPDEALKHGTYMMALMADPDIEAILARAMPKVKP
jgi:hypothetical protein